MARKMTRSKIEMELRQFLDNPNNLTVTFYEDIVKIEYGKSIIRIPFIVLKTFIINKKRKIAEDVVESLVKLHIHSRMLKDSNAQVEFHECTEGTE